MLFSCNARLASPLEGRNPEFTKTSIISAPASISVLLTVPCDSPLFPLDLVQKLQEALEQENADIAVAAAKEEDGKVRPQPVFCLMRVSLLESLVKFMQSGGRKIDAWTAQHSTVLVSFDGPEVDPRAFFNANTLEELHRLEKIS